MYDEVATRMTPEPHVATAPVPAAAPPREHAHSLHASLLLGAVGLSLLFVYAPTIAWLWGRWTMSVWHHAHGLLIPPLVAYFASQELRRFRGQPASSSALGFLFVVPALAMHVLDTAMQTQLLSAASIVLLMPGLALLFLGVERTKAIAFPLLFLAFMLPIPLAFTEHLHLVLRKIAAVGTAFVLPLTGLPVFRDGYLLHLPNADLLVADACSGFSTLYASVAVACLVAYTTPSWRRRLAVLVLAVPIALAANLVRVVLLSWLVYTQGIGVLETWQHSASGMLTFALALPLIFWIGESKSSRPQ
jgi:exosortase